MLRLTDLQLPLNHPESALRETLLVRLGVADDQLLAVRIFRRAADARKKSAIHLVYTVDVEVVDEAVNLQALAYKAGKDSKAKDNLLSTMKDLAPSLSDDPEFMKQFMKSIEGSEEKEKEAAEK
jgi:uncharacterized FAD-dependent dehydrogenase